MSAVVAKSERRQLGFAWWTFQGWASLIVGTLIALGTMKDIGGLAVVLAVLNIGISMMTIRFSKIAFVIGTVLSLNPVLWIINGIYIKNRWRDPRVLENRDAEQAQDAEPSKHGGATRTVNSASPGGQAEPAATSASIATKGTVPSSEPLELKMPLDEELWEHAMLEVDSPDRRQGLWAKCFGESQGVEPATKAAYMAARVAEMKAALLAEREAADQRYREEEEDRRLAHLDEERRAYERLPKGRCPNCEAIIPLASVNCAKCEAYFGEGAAWGVKPLQ